MNIEQRISAFIQLGDKINSLTADELLRIAATARTENAWFDAANTIRSIEGIKHILLKESLEEWVSRYDLQIEVPKIIGIVMAGNIPLVGFHDLLCVLLSGNFAAIKTSSQDSVLVKWILAMLLEIAPAFKKSLEIRDRLTNVDAVIATGSDNTARYFEYYFKNVPHIIRKNRSSIAVLTGDESEEDLKNLGRDIFWYYGLGCRNVSKLIIPKGYHADTFFEAIQEYEEVGNHHKYRNNYDYNKSIYLVNGEKHLDNGFLLWRASDQLVSPISVIYVQEFENEREVKNYLTSNEAKIQCIVGNDHIPFGQAQLPNAWDYADNVDTLDFLIALK